MFEKKVIKITWIIALSEVCKNIHVLLPLAIDYLDSSWHTCDSNEGKPPLVIYTCAFTL